MASERQFEAAAECHAADCGRHRLAAGLQGTEQLVDTEDHVEQLCPIGVRASQAAKLAQIGAGAEAAGLAGGDDRTLYRGVGAQAVHDLAKLAQHLGGQRVHGAIWDIEDHQRHTGIIESDGEIVHCFIPAR